MGASDRYYYSSSAFITNHRPPNRRSRFAAFSIQPDFTNNKKSLAFSGVRLTITNSDKPLLSILLIALVVWFAGTYAVKAKALFFPLAIGISSILTASLVIEPRILAPLLVEIAALISVPLLIQSELRPIKGVLRFLSFQTIGMGLVLLGNWMIIFSRIQSNLQLDQVIPLIVIGVGLAMTLPIFPFHSWINLLSQESDPYLVGYIFFIFPMTNAVLAVSSLLRLNLDVNSVEFSAAI